MGNFLHTQPLAGVLDERETGTLGYNFLNALVAQWIECLTSNQSVERSNRSGGTFYWRIRYSS